MKCIVIVGAGFAGLRAARLIAKRAKRRAAVFLIDQKEKFVFTPWLVDVLSGDLDGKRITRSLQAIAHRDGFTFIRGQVQGVDRRNRTVLVKTNKNETAIAYDILIMCQGATTNFYDIPGAEKNSLPYKTEKDVEPIKNAVRRLLQKSGKRICVVGAGPSGVETVFALQRFTRRFYERHPKCAKTPATLSIIEAAPQILPGFSEKIVKATASELKKNEIEFQVGDAVASVNDRTINLASGRKLTADLILWTAGVASSAVPFNPRVSLDQGYYVVDNYLRLDQHTFAAGDVSSFKRQGIRLTRSAQTALQMSKTLIRNVLAKLCDKPLRPFKTASRGTIITLGGTAVGNFFNLITFKSRLWLKLRSLFYAWRFRQITGG